MSADTMNEFADDPEVRAAVLRNTLAEASKNEAEAKYQAAQARRETAMARYAELTLKREQRTEEFSNASDLYNRVYRFNDAVDDRSVKSCVNTLNYWRRTESACDFEIVFYSPGGSVFSGMYLYDFIQELRGEGHYVTTRALGMAASMGGILLQAGDHRVMGAEARVLIHQISGFSGGKVFEIEDEVQLMKDMGDRILNIFVRRAAEASENGTASHPLTKVQLKRSWERKDWWLDSDECLKYGIVDEVR